MIVPHDELQPDTLKALIEEFVTRDGAVHGHTDQPTDRQIEQVMRQLKAGHAVIIFDEEDESCSILTKEEAARLQWEQRSTEFHPDENEIRYEEPPDA